MHDPDGQISFLLQVEFNHRGVVHFVDMITRQNDDEIGPTFADVVDVLQHSI